MRPSLATNRGSSPRCTSSNTSGSRHRNAHSRRHFPLSDSVSFLYLACLFFSLLVACVNDSSCVHIKTHRTDHHSRRQHQRQQHEQKQLHMTSHRQQTSSSLLAPMSNKIRHARGKYTVREEVIRRVEITHPCKLTRTAVKVTFPGMKKEVLVSFIGYKEPNLMFVNRCKGLCSADAVGHVACVPTKRSWKKVNMHFKTQVLGREDVKEKYKELVLEEHEECECQCLTVTPAHCMSPELFNEETCSCQCDTSVYKRDRLQCEAYPNRVWNERTCSCSSRSEADSMLPPSVVGGPSGSLSGGQDNRLFENSLMKKKQRDQEDHDRSGPMLYDPPVPHHGCTECLNCLTLVGGVEGLHGKDDFLTKHSWKITGTCTALIAIFFTSTVFFWRKSRRLKEELEGSNGSEEDGSSSRDGDGGRSTSPRSSSAGGGGGEKFSGGRPRLTSLAIEASGDTKARLSRTNSLSELEARDLLLSNATSGKKEVTVALDTNGKGSMSRHSHQHRQRLTNSLGRSSGDRAEVGRGDVVRSRDSTSPIKISPKRGKGASSSGERSGRGRAAGDEKDHHSKSGAGGGTGGSGAKKKDKESSSAAKKRHRAHKKKMQQQQQQQDSMFVDTDILNESELIQQCYFEDDLDPNFINHQKIGAAEGM